MNIRSYSFFLLLIFLTSCKDSNIGNLKLKSKEMDSVVCKVSNDKFSIFYTKNSSLFLTDLKNDTLIKIKEEGVFPKSITFMDFNNDGFEDLRYGYTSNYYFENIWLYNPSKSKFQKIDSIDHPEFAYAKKIKNLYFSYSPNGCGKNNWVSYLFSIENYKVKPQALIDYKQCADDEKGMYLYKLCQKKNVLISKTELSIADKIELEKFWLMNMKKIACP